MRNNLKRILFSMILMIGLVVTGVLVQSTQETRRRAAEGEVSCGEQDGVVRMAGETWCQEGSPQMVKKCLNDSTVSVSEFECGPGDECVNGKCEFIKEGCTTPEYGGKFFSPGQIVCVSETSYRECQANNQYSEIKSCGENQICDFGMSGYHCVNKDTTCIDYEMSNQYNTVYYAPGEVLCKSDNSYVRCLDDSTFSAELKCDEGSLCYRGKGCVRNGGCIREGRLPAFDGDTYCDDNDLSIIKTCLDSNWLIDKCSEGEGCDNRDNNENPTAFKCVKKVDKCTWNEADYSVGERRCGEDNPKEIFTCTDFGWDFGMIYDGSNVTCETKKESFTNGKCKLCRKPYVCDTSAKNVGARFLIDLMSDENTNLDVGTTIVFEIGVDSTGRSITGIDADLDFDASILKILKVDNLINLLTMKAPYDSGVLSFYNGNPETIYSRVFKNEKIARITFEVLKKVNNWSIKFKCVNSSMTDSNLLNAENGVVTDLISCGDNEWFYVDETGNKLNQNPFGCDESALRQNDPKFRGDYNCDGDLTGGDYIVWRGEFIDKKYEFGVQSDGNCDGKSSLIDYSRWREEYLK